MRRRLLPLLGLTLLASPGRADEAELRRRIEALEQRLAGLAKPALAARWERGLVIDLGGDGGACLAVTGLVQARVVGELVPQQAGVDSFDLHHAQLAATFEAGRLFAAHLLVDFGHAYFPAAPFAIRSSLLRDAWLEVRPLAWLSLRAGQIVVPFGRQRQLADGALVAVERNPATLAFAADRDLGGLVEARLWRERILLQAAVSDGVNAGEPGARNDNLDLRWVGRAVLAPLGPLGDDEADPSASAPARLSVGGAVMYDITPTDDPIQADRDQNGRLDGVEVIAANAELAVEWRRLSLQGEYFFRRHRYGALAPVPVRSFHGASAQLALTAVRRYLVVAAHASYIEPYALGRQLAMGGTPALPFGPSPGANASLLDTVLPLRSWAVGATLVGLYSRGERSHGAKLQLTYDWHHRTLATGEIDAHVLQIQASLGY